MPTLIRAVKPRTKPYNLTDERGLYLIVTPSGSRWWRFKYSLDRKEKGLSIGVYPDVPLALARKRRDEARQLIASGIEIRGIHGAAHRARQRCGQIFRYAVVTARAAHDITADLRGALAPMLSKNHAALTDPVEIGKRLRAIEGYRGFVTDLY